MIRIITGNLKGKKINVPKSGTRPILDKTRTSIFDLLRGLIDKSKILDLYAGSGIMGIEAISRGAECATFVDYSQNALQIIKNNLNLCSLKNCSKTIKSTCNAFIKQELTTTDYDKYNIIFIDPPFTKQNFIDLKNLEKLMEPKGIIVIRSTKNLENITKKSFQKSTLEEIYIKNYGLSQVTFYKSLKYDKMR